MNISFLRPIVKVNCFSSLSLGLGCILPVLSIRSIHSFKMHLSPLSVVGRVTQLQPIPNADFVEVATSECGELGVWKGVVNKSSLTLGQLCTVNMMLLYLSYHNFPLWRNITGVFQ